MRATSRRPNLSSIPATTQNRSTLIASSTRRNIWSPIVIDMSHIINLKTAYLQINLWNRSNQNKIISSISISRMKLLGMNCRVYLRQKALRSLNSKLVRWVRTFNSNIGQTILQKKQLMSRIKIKYWASRNLRNKCWQQSSRYLN